MPLRLGSTLSVESLRRDLTALAELSDSDFRALAAMLREADGTLDREFFHEKLHERLSAPVIERAERAAGVTVFLLSESASRGLTATELQEDLAQMGLGPDELPTVQGRLGELFDLRDHILRFSTASDAASEGLPNFQHASVVLDLRLAYPHVHAEELRDLGPRGTALAGVEPVVIITIETDTDESFSFQANRRQLTDLHTLVTLWTDRMRHVETTAPKVAALLQGRTK